MNDTRYEGRPRGRPRTPRRLHRRRVTLTLDPVTVDLLDTYVRRVGERRRRPENRSRAAERALRLGLRLLYYQDLKEKI